MSLAFQCVPFPPWEMTGWDLAHPKSCSHSPERVKVSISWSSSCQGWKEWEVGIWAPISWVSSGRGIAGILCGLPFHFCLYSTFLLDFSLTPLSAAWTWILASGFSGENPSSTHSATGLLGKPKEDPGCWLSEAESLKNPYHFLNPILNKEKEKNSIIKMIHSWNPR